MLNPSIVFNATPLLFSFSESSSIKSDLKTGSTVRLPLATIIESLFHLVTLKQSSLNFTLSDSPLSMFTARCLCRSSQMLIHQAHRERDAWYDELIKDI
uniref:Uncharacterized protein n=2 Tax=Brassica oleracea TaxID=3712 RepID=A0A0D3E8B3_BRAOL